MSKYREIYEYLKQLIIGHMLLPGERLSTEKDLCEQFDASRPTVRQAILLLVKEGYIERIQGSGTYVKKHGLDGIVQQTELKIGVVITYLDEYIFPSIIQGIESTLTQNGYCMHLTISNNMVGQERRVLQALLSSGVQGLIIEPAKSALPNMNLRLYEQIKSANIPCIFMHGYHRGLDIPHVTLNDIKVGYAITEHLIQRGHTKIAGIFKSDNIQGQFRYSGYAQCMMDHDLEIRDENIFWYASEDLRYFRTNSYREILLERLQGVTAVVCYNDQPAVAIMDILRSEGFRVPKDYSIVGVDNSSIAAMNGITSVVHPQRKLGAILAQNLIRLMQDPSYQATVEIEPIIVERSSVALLETEV